MADPVSMTASVLAIMTAAIVSARSLCDTIKGFRNRHKMLQRLQKHLQDLVTILETLAQLSEADASVISLLKGPIDRCTATCHDFEKVVKKFYDKPKTGLLDWTKLEFMKGDINDFIDNIDRYKSTIQLGLCCINLRNSKVTRKAIQEYEEMIKDTEYNLKLHLQQIDEKLTQCKSQDGNVSEINIDLQDERMVTQQCLRVCQDMSSHIGGVTIRESTFSCGTVRTDDQDYTPKNFKAQVLMQQAFNSSQAILLGASHEIGKYLQFIVGSKGSKHEHEHLQLQEDRDVSKQCLEVCKIAGEVSRQKIHIIEETLAEDNSDQVVVTTVADLFYVHTAYAKKHSAQLTGTFTASNFECVITERYKSRFCALPDRSASSHADSCASPFATTLGLDNLEQPVLNEKDRDTWPFKSETGLNRPRCNETKKR